MSTYGDLKTQIASDLRRSNLGPEIAQAILDAIRDHDSERFWWNETAIYTLNTVVGQDTYELNPQPPILEFVLIDRLRAQIPGVWYTVKPATIDQIEDLYSTPSNGQPARWAVHGNEIRIYPYPAAIYPIKIFGHYRLMPLVLDSDSNQWTNEGKNLIRYTALRRLFAFPIRDMNQMQSAEASGLRQLEYLRRESDRRAREGRMKAYYG